MVLSSVEGFFCQTTTSEERDLVGQGVEKDPLLIDDSAGHYLSRSSQESEEDITRCVSTALSLRELVNMFKCTVELYKQAEIFKDTRKVHTA